MQSFRHNKAFLRVFYYTVAILSGVAGIGMLFFGLALSIDVILDNPWRIGLVFILILTSTLGGYLVYLAYLMCWKQSLKAIRHISLYLAFLVFGEIEDALTPAFEALSTLQREKISELLSLLLNLAVFVVVIGLYKIVKNLLLTYMTSRDPETNSEK